MLISSSSTGPSFEQSQRQPRLWTLLPTLLGLSLSLPFEAGAADHGQTIPASAPQSAPATQPTQDLRDAHAAPDPPDPIVLSRLAEVQRAWDRGTLDLAAQLLDEALRERPKAPALHKLRGDMLSTQRRSGDAVAAYNAALALQPDSLSVLWAKWGVLQRSGQPHEAVGVLQRLASLDRGNPLVHLRLAQELRKLDRLEESFESYRQAVTLAPDVLSWRMGLARARFDLLDYTGAEQDLQIILGRVAPGTPLESPARNLLTAIQSSQDRGRRFESKPAGEIPAAQLKEWADARGEAWQLYSNGHFAAAEPALRTVLALNPNDPTVIHQLGVTLMQLGRCEEALSMFRRVTGQDSQEEAVADSVFRMGQCYADLERWEEAYVQFHLLYTTALEFEEATKGSALPPDARVLDKGKIQRWLDRVRPHVPEFAAAVEAEMRPAPTSREQKPTEATEEELLRRAMERLKPQQVLDTRAPLLGRDSDFSWFRSVIPAAKVLRDDSPTGAHDYLPIDTGDTFTAPQQPIHLVFALVTSSYDETPLTARCFLEATETAESANAIAQDRVVVSMNDQSGYFLLTPPTTGWVPGLYRCGLYAGERTTAYNHVDEVRFRVVAPPSS